MSYLRRGKTTLTFTQEFSDGEIYTSTVSINNDCLDIHRTMQELVKPVLFAAGFHESLVNEYIEEI